MTNFPPLGYTYVNPWTPLYPIPEENKPPPEQPPITPPATPATAVPDPDSDIDNWPIEPFGD